jgi:hypothetical protein
MDINISQTMNFSQYENRESLRNAARNILNREHNSESAVKTIIDRTIFDTNLSTDSARQILSTSAQITLNNSLKETLKYIKNNSKKKPQTKLGTLWGILSESKNDFDENLYKFEIDTNAKNIFEAA